MVDSIDFVLETAQVEALRWLLQKLEQEISPAEPMRIYIAGGMAVHLYTGYRTTVDVDAEFSQRVLIPQSLFVDTRDGGVLYIDPSYNSTFALMHEDYLADSIPVPIGTTLIQPYVLHPVDLIVSKIARFAGPDRGDIQELIDRFQIPVEAIEKRAEEALGGFVGNTAYLRMNLNDVLGMARASAAEQESEAGVTTSSVPR
jgi:hypothetical protein